MTIDEAVRRRPAARLSSVAAWYQGYRQRDVAPARHAGLPSPFLTLIFTIDEPLEIAQHVDPTRSPGRYDTLAGGLHTTPAVITHNGAQSGVQVLASPLAARRLFGRPASELVGYDGDARDVLGDSAKELHERLHAAPSWVARFALVDEVLSHLVSAHDHPREPPPAVVTAWHLLLDSGGQMAISEIANLVGYGERHLANQFRAELGLTPKAAARLIRFDVARRALQWTATTGHCRISDIAARSGYCDQSHLVRDFTQFAGQPPSRWLAQEFGNVQADRWYDPAEWPA